MTQDIQELKDAAAEYGVDFNELYAELRDSWTWDDEAISLAVSRIQDRY